MNLNWFIRPAKGKRKWPAEGCMKRASGLRDPKLRPAFARFTLIVSKLDGYPPVACAPPAFTCDHCRGHVELRRQENRVLSGAARMASGHFWTQRVKLNSLVFKTLTYLLTNSQAHKPAHLQLPSLARPLPLLLSSWSLMQCLICVPI